MAGNILIISSDYTGHGHKSITNSLMEKFAAYPDIKVHVIDGFSLGGNIGVRMGKMYGPITRNAKYLWKFIWEVSMKSPSVINEFTRLSIHDNFLKVLKNIKPDVILSVHPGFVSPVMDILEEHHINIPFVTLIADLISISALWADKRAVYTLCPTHEAMQRCMQFGVPDTRLKVTGFPVREKFCKHISSDNYEISYAPDHPLRCLIMSGGEGSGNMGRMAKTLLSNFNCHVKIITGRNAVLKKRLENTLLIDFPGKVEIYGFVENIQDLMIDSDLAFTRGSPNVMMEAVTCNVPLIVTGALPGQEEENPAYLEKYSLGVICNDLEDIKSVVENLLEDDCKKLNLIKRSQREYRNPDTASDIAGLIMSIEPDGDVHIPQTYKKYNLGKRTNRFIVNGAGAVKRTAEKAGRLFSMKR